MPVVTPPKITGTPRRRRVSGAAVNAPAPSSVPNPQRSTVREPPAPSAGARRSSHAGATTRATGIALAEGVSLKAGRLLVDGFPVIERATLRRSGGQALVSAAARLADNDGVKKLSASARQALTRQLLPILERHAAGRASLHFVAARSGAFALLEQLMAHMRGSSEQRDAKAIAAALFAAEARETHVGLKVHLQRRLAALPARLVPAAQREAQACVKAALAHDRPLRERWITGTPPTLKVLASVQDEFWKKELSAWRKDGFTVSEAGADKALAEKTVSDVEPPVRIRIDLRRRDSDVLDGIGDFDTDVVLYTGHAQLGGVAKQSLTNGPDTANGTKLVAFFACRSKQNLGALERSYPGQHVLVSAEGTYGHDDGIVAHTLLDGIVHNKSYAQIESAARKQSLWEMDNYLLPHETTAMIQPPPVFMPVLRTAQGTSVSMRPRATDRVAAEIPSGPVNDAVDWLNTVHGYWSEQRGVRADHALHDRLRSGGFFDGADGAARPAVRVSFNTDGSATVSVNRAWAHQDPDALAMMITFEAAQQILAHTQPRLSEHDRRMTALAMMGEYVFFLVEYSDVADVLLKQFAKVYGFPQSLDWPLVERSVLADMENDASPKTIAVMEKGLRDV